MKNFISKTFSLNLKILKILGLYPPETSAKIHQIQAILFYMLFIIPLPILGGLYIFLQENLDIVTVADNAFLISEVACYYFKLIPFVFKGDTIKTCILYLERPIFINQIMNEKQAAIVANCGRICTRNSWIFLAIVSCTVFNWAIKPAVLGEFRFPVDIWLPFDVYSEGRTTFFYCIYTFIVISVVYAAISSAMIDPLVAGLACQAQGQFQVLKDNLEFLDEYCPSGNGSEKNDLIYGKIIACTNHHNAILEYLKFYEECFSIVAFSQFLGSTFVICVSCLQLSIVEPLTMTFFIMIMYLCSMLLELYLYCYYGTTVHLESDGITNAVYMGKWYEFDVKCKKALILLMERSKKPVTLTALKILNLSLDTFTLIIKRSYSLLAVLRSF